jgi:hypothetical protein
LINVSDENRDDIDIAILPEEISCFLVVERGVIVEREEWGIEWILGVSGVRGRIGFLTPRWMIIMPLTNLPRVPNL